MGKILIAIRNRLILALAGRSPIVLNCEWTGSITLQGPHALVDNCTVRPG